MRGAIEYGLKMRIRMWSSTFFDKIGKACEMTCLTSTFPTFCNLIRKLNESNSIDLQNENHQILLESKNPDEILNFFC